MAKINQIQRALLELSGGDFHKLVNSYLIKKGYENIIPIGTVLGKNKSNTGTPDTLIAGKDGNYTFAEITTQQEGIISKFEKDVDKCLNPEKTGIKISNINEIVLAYNTDVDLKLFEKTRERCQNKGVNLNFFGLKTISYDLLEKFPALAKNYLGIEIDTGQILVPDEFIRTYNNNKLAAPLDTTFYFREDVLKEGLTSLKKNKLTILTGNAGVGKSRLALELCKRFTDDQPNCRAYCVLDKGVDLFDDTKAYFSEPGKYLIYIDDANRITNFNYFIDLVLNQQNDQTIKLIATVRDYAVSDINRKARRLSDNKTINLSPFNKEQVVEFLEEEFTITNTDFHDQIFKISQGNPRLTVMAAKLAKRENRFSAITDVSNLYEEYYESIRDDLKEIGSPNLLKVAAIIAFFRSVDRTNDELMRTIQTVFEIRPEEFWQYSLKLHELEIVDLYEDEVVKTSDQVLATYLFYLTYFQKSELNIGKLIRHFLSTQKQRLIDVLSPVYAAFDSEKISNTLQPEIDELWNKYEERKDEDNLINLMESFWYLKKTETLIYLKKKVRQLKREKFTEEQLNLEPSSRVKSNTLLSLISHFKYASISEFKTALDLLLSYYDKKPSKASEIIYLLTKKFGFTHKSHKAKYIIQRIIFEKLIKKAEEGANRQFTLALLKVSESYLHIHFDTNIPEKGSVRIIRFDLLATPELLDLRKKIWNTLFSLAQKESYKNDVLRLIYEYSHFAGRGRRKKILEEDAKLILAFIKEKWNNQTFKHCLIAQTYLSFLERKEIDFNNDLKQKFFNHTYKIYDLLCSTWADFHPEMEHKEYQKLRKDKLTNHFSDYTFPDFRDFFSECETIKNNLIRENALRQLPVGITDVLITVSEIDYTLFKDVIKYYLSKGNIFGIPQHDIVRVLIDNSSTDEVYNLLANNNYQNKSKWLFQYYVELPDHYIKKTHVEYILDLYRQSDRKNIYHDFDFLLKYRKVDDRVVVKVLEILLQKIQEDNKFSFTLRNLFNSHSEVQQNLEDLFKDDVELIEEAYLKFSKADKNAAYRSDSFNKILNLDPHFIIKSLEDGFNNEESIFSNNRDRDYSAIWDRDDHSQLMERVILKIIELWNDPKIIIGHNVLKSFFHTGDKDQEPPEEQMTFIHDMIEKYAKRQLIMQLIFNVAVDFKTEVRKGLLKHFLQLNKKLEDFKRLQLTSGAVSGPSLIGPLQAQINFLQSLIPLVDTARFLEHKQYLENKIKDLRNWMEQEKKREFTRDY